MQLVTRHRMQIAWRIMPTVPQATIISKRILHSLLQSVVNLALAIRDVHRDGAPSDTSEWKTTRAATQATNDE